ncbi:MAG TPA: aspartate--tRNA ligase [Longimicrobiaceae bacterium]|nr:aspartate--tRNA ligase [Longimicrobiaceae bacterium]
MNEAMPTRYRSTVAGILRGTDIGREVRLVGWVHRRRDLGGLVFIDLRDRSGMVQVSFDPEWSPPEVVKAARGLGPEDVIQVTGTVAVRPGGNVNTDLPTGEIEIRSVSLEIISAAEALPIPVYRTPDEELPAEDLRLRYRYLDLRRPELQRNLMIRNRAARSVRDYLADEGFIEIETPMLTRRTPEGARDYLVPSRVHPGEFYALPQSPQLYKQLLMVSGFDRYFQITRCLRDEDLRADRQPEFTQIDAEMAFVDEEDVMRVGEGMVAALWHDVLGVDLPLPMRRITYSDAMARYASDKPDLRYDLEIRDVTDVLQGAEFRIFEATRGTPQRIRGMRIPGGAALSRRELDGLQDVAKRAGGAGALWVKRTEEGFSGQFAKALDGQTAEAFVGRTGLEPGDLFVAVVGPFRTSHPDLPVEHSGAEGTTEEPNLEPVLDELRRHLAARMDLIDPDAHAWLWVTEFPLFDWDADAERLVAAHHPFTMPHPDDIAAIMAATDNGGTISTTDARRLYEQGLRSRAYDAVYNGSEMASGSVRIHESSLQQRIFHALGMADDEVASKFGFLLEAFRFGAPPHAGFAFGFDRLAMLLVGAPSLRDVIAFPKTTAARALFEGAPSPIAEAELRDLHIRLPEPDSM